MAVLLTTNWQTIASYRFAPGTGFIADFRLEAKYSGQDTSNNFTSIQTRLVSSVVQGSGSGSGYGFSLSYANSISGTSVWYIQNETILSGGDNIYHNPDGTKSLTLSASMRVNYTGLNASMSGDVILPTIKRYPQITNAPNFNDEQNPTISFSNPAAYPIRVKIEAGGNTQLIVRDDVSQTASSYTFSLTNTERTTLRRLATTNVLRVKFSVCAMSGNTEINVSSTEREMSIVNATPTLTYTIEETNSKITSILGTSANTILQNVSRPKVVISPTAYKEATIKSTTLTDGNNPYVATTSPYEITFTATTGQFNIYAIDSRDNSSNITQIKKTLVQYLPIAIQSLSFTRKNPTSSTIVLNLVATYYQVTLGTRANVPLVRWKLNDGSYTTINSSHYVIDNTKRTLTINNLEIPNVLQYTEPGTLGISVSDLFTSKTDKKEVTKGIPTFDVGDTDLQVNGDLFIADTNRKNAINVKEMLNNLLCDAYMYAKPNADTITPSGIFNWTNLIVQSSKNITYDVSGTQINKAFFKFDKSGLYAISVYNHWRNNGSRFFTELELIGITTGFRTKYRTTDTQNNSQQSGNDASTDNTFIIPIQAGDILTIEMYSINSATFLEDSSVQIFKISTFPIDASPISLMSLDEEMQEVETKVINKTNMLNKIEDIEKIEEIIPKIENTQINEEIIEDLEETTEEIAEKEEEE